MSITTTTTTTAAAIASVHAYSYPHFVHPPSSTTLLPTPPSILAVETDRTAPGPGPCPTFAELCVQFPEFEEWLKIDPPCPTTDQEQDPDQDQYQDHVFQPLRRGQPLSSKEIFEADLEHWTDTLLREDFIDVPCLEITQRHHQPSKVRHVQWLDAIIESVHEAWSHIEYDRKKVPDYIRNFCEHRDEEDEEMQLGGIGVSPYDGGQMGGIGLSLEDVARFSSEPQKGAGIGIGIASPIRQNGQPPYQFQGSSGFSDEEDSSKTFSLAPMRRNKSCNFSFMGMGM